MELHHCVEECGHLILKKLFVPLVLHLNLTYTNAYFADH
jgi:hypothetical protein